MQMHFFAIAALDPAEGQAELNQFLGAHRVTGIERQFVPAGTDSHWAVCVSIVQGPEPLPQALKAESTRGAKLDYKQVLSADDFAVYAELRNLRKHLADEAGVPVYAVFSNEQLAAMVQQRAQTLDAMGAIDGVGAARLQRYGQAFLELLGPAWGTPA